MHKRKLKLERPTQFLVKRWQVISLLSVALILIGAIFVFLHHTVTLAAPAAPAVHKLALGDWSTYMYDNQRSGYNSNETVINNTTASQLKLHFAGSSFLKYVHLGLASHLQWKCLYWYCHNW